MPAPGNIQTNYPDLLKEHLGIILLESYKGAKLHHLMQCGDCGHKWSATPLSKMQNYKKYPNSKGCPSCYETTRHNKHHDVRQDTLKKISTAGLRILTEGYNGKRGDIYFTIRVQHADCGHIFDLRVANFLNRKLVRSNSCKLCGIRTRSLQLTQTSLDRHEEWLKTATEWQLYKYEVNLETNKSYRQYKHIIDPNNLPRGSIDGGYHLDHIISRRYCFDNDIPVEICGNYQNLQMLPWRDNISKGTRLVTNIPEIFNKYIKINVSIELDEPDTIEEQRIFSDLDN